LSKLKPPRLSPETEIKAEQVANPFDRYTDLPNVLGEAIAYRLIDDGILEQTDSVVVQNRKPQLDVSVKGAFDLLDSSLALGMKRDLMRMTNYCIL